MPLFKVDSLLNLPKQLFYKCGQLETITLPATLETIESEAFLGCNSLEEITIPDKVTNIGNRAFYGCGNLRSVTMDCKLQTLPRQMFSNCYRLEDITLPTTLETIESGAFWECNSLEEIIIPDKVTTIGDKAFGAIYTYNGNLYNDSEFSIYQNVTLPDDRVFPNRLSRVSIGASVRQMDGAFDYCTNLLEFVVSPENPKYDSRDGCKAIIETAADSLIRGGGNSQIPESVFAIAPGAFTRCHALHSITIPEHVRFIGENAFHECLELRHVQFDAKDCDFKVNYYYSVSDDGYISKEYRLSPFTYLEIERTITPFFQVYFSGGTHVYPVSVTIGPNVERLPSYLLNKQSELTSIRLPQSLKAIGDYALAETDLRRIALPESVISLGLSVFKNAPLTRLICHSKFPPYCTVDLDKGEHSLSGMNYASCQLRVPADGIEFYRVAFPWREFLVIEAIQSGPKSSDLNGDGQVDIADLNIVINMMLGKGESDITPTQADLNDDGNVDIADLNTVINAMLGTTD